MRSVYCTVLDLTGHKDGRVAGFTCGTFDPISAQFAILSMRACTGWQCTACTADVASKASSPKGRAVKPNVH